MDEQKAQLTAIELEITQYALQALVTKFNDLGGHDISMEECLAEARANREERLETKCYEPGSRK